jgi:site-specific DNA-cytosine methylase
MPQRSPAASAHAPASQSGGRPSRETPCTWLQSAHEHQVAIVVVEWRALEIVVVEWRALEMGTEAHELEIGVAIGKEAHDLEIAKQARALAREARGCQGKGSERRRPREGKREAAKARGARGGQGKGSERRPREGTSVPAASPSPPMPEATTVRRAWWTAAMATLQSWNMSMATLQSPHPRHQRLQCARTMGKDEAGCCMVFRECILLT